MCSYASTFHLQQSTLVPCYITREVENEFFNKSEHMPIYDRGEIDRLDKRYRSNLINSITGFKPANLIGTRSQHGVPNLAIFSSVVHMGSNPPLIGCIFRPVTVPRHTYDNIQHTSHYTINHVHHDFVETAHYTSAKFAEDVSEFTALGFTEEYIADFPAPFVGESRIKFGLKKIDEIAIPYNGTIFMIGEIQLLQIPDEWIDKEGMLDLEGAGSAAISGLNTYYAGRELESFPYARVEEIMKRRKV